MTTQLSYACFAQANRELHDIEPIDYFFAKEMVSYYPSQKQALVFHVLLALSQHTRFGHTCLPLATIANHRFGFKSDDTGVITHHGYDFPTLDILTTLAEQLFIVPDHHKGICYHNQCLYMRRNYQFEQELQTALVTRLKMKAPVNVELLQRTIKSLFCDPISDSQSITHELDWQKVAVANALNKKISVIAGGPGTGKTYTVTKLIAALIAIHQQTPTNSEKLNISLVAPTGKAAQRLSESIVNAVDGFKGVIDQSVLSEIPTDAQTLHRFLGVIPNQLQFKHHQDNLVQCDVLILDEVSMVDLALMVRLFRALPKETQVIMLGDADQLPSVALGSVLADIAPKPHPGYSAKNLAYLESVAGEQTISAQLKQLAKQHKKSSQNQCADHLSFLYKSRRFDGQGGIGLIAKAVINGDSQASWQLLNAEPANPELNFANDLEQYLSRVVDQYYLPLTQAKSLKEAFNILSTFRILCASRKGQQGVEVLNEKIAQRLGKTLHHKSKLYHGLPIMINENNYTLGLYNGDIGLVWRNEHGQLLVAFEDPEQSYRMIMPTRLPGFEPVYAMTIHKTQGSEFGHVYMVLSNQKDSKLLSRELMYTGITRAKKQLTITATEPVWFNGVDTKVQRYSNLSLSTNTINE